MTLELSTNIQLIIYTMAIIEWLKLKKIYIKRLLEEEHFLNLQLFVINSIIDNNEVAP
jgi:hypothetical protein